MTYFLSKCYIRLSEDCKKMVKCWCHCGPLNELNDSIIRKCKVNNNITNCSKTEQAEVLIENRISCDVNNKEAKLLDY